MKLSDRIIEALSAPNPDEQTVSKRLTPEQRIRLAEAESREVERAMRRITYWLMVALATVMGIVIAYMALK